MELADMIIVNKADGNLEAASKHTTTGLLYALRLVAPKTPFWNTQENGWWDHNRRTQQTSWMWRQVDSLLLDRFFTIIHTFSILLSSKTLA
ncbi:putative GTPase [Smittium culicis]|uniref:Putative GTPase n=1 Tax=Smittium culicis TaxID=133412 RepID=A0A1R1XS39_9FUNG|nr:putative GTPase [Smittium culicis]